MNKNIEIILKKIFFHRLQYPEPEIRYNINFPYSLVFIIHLLWIPVYLYLIAGGPFWMYFALMFISYFAAISLSFVIKYKVLLGIIGIFRDQGKMDDKIFFLFLIIFYSSFPTLYFIFIPYLCLWFLRHLHRTIVA